MLAVASTCALEFSTSLQWWWACTDVKLLESYRQQPSYCLYPFFYLTYPWKKGYTLSLWTDPDKLFNQLPLNTYRKCIAHVRLFVIQGTLDRESFDRHTVCMEILWTAATDMDTTFCVIVCFTFSIAQERPLHEKQYLQIFCRLVPKRWNYKNRFSMVEDL